MVPSLDLPNSGAVLPITDDQKDAAKELHQELLAAGWNAELRTEGPLRRRVRDAELDKIPYMAVLGGREVEEGAVNLRVHGQKEQRTMSHAEFFQMLQEKKHTKSLEY